jgi:hypothetical protein
LAAQANSAGIVFWKLCKVTALWAQTTFKNSGVTGGAKFVAFMNAPNFCDIFAAFIAHLEIMSWLGHRCAKSSFRCNRAIMRFT